MFEVPQAARVDAAKLAGAYKVCVRFANRNLTALYRQVETTAQQLGNVLRSRALQTAARVRGNTECPHATLRDLRPSAQVFGETSRVAIGQKKDYLTGIGLDGVLSKGLFVDLRNFASGECVRNWGQPTTSVNTLVGGCGNEKILKLEQWVEDKLIEYSLMKRKRPADRADVVGLNQR